MIRTRPTSSRGAQFLDDQPGFDGLAQTHLVREDHPRLQLLRHSVRDEYLMQLRLDTGARQARQRVIPIRMLQV